MIILEALDRKEIQRFEWNTELPIDGTLDLLKGVYNRIQKDYQLPLSGFSSIHACRCTGRLGPWHFIDPGGGHPRRFRRISSSCAG